MSIENSGKRARRTIKIATLYCAKYLGLFELAKKKYRKELRILCYHGFSDGDHAEWDGELFITPEIFAARMEYLKKNGFNILPLEHALDSLYRSNLPDFSVVITIDDGWFGIKRHAHPILQGNCYTVYVTSYYCIKEAPIYNIAIPYILWKAQEKGGDIATSVATIESAFGEFDNTSELSNYLISYGHDKLNHEQRMDLLKLLCASLDISFDDTFGEKCFHILSRKELRELSEQGVDIQLHTHRHRWPSGEIAAMEEIQKNREILEEATGCGANHLCYPSGEYSVSQFPYLTKLDVKSATTCQVGLNFRSTHKYQLNRFLDSSEISQVEFEAEVSGFLEGMRVLRKMIQSKQQL